MIPEGELDPAVDTGYLVDEACATCHTDVHPSHAGVTEGSPTCTQCHDFHGDSEVASTGLAMSARCGECHTQELAEHGTGGHREGLVSQNGGAPDCLSCHESHVNPADGLAATRFRATLSCIQCHNDDLLVEAYGLPELAARSYEKDFHGQTLRFLFDHPDGRNQPDVMVCSDCHGAHQVAWVGAEEVSEVCVSCHEKASFSLAGAWLGHGKVGPRNASLVWLARVFYFVFIPLVLGGLIVNILFHLQDQRRKGARVHNTEGVQKLGRRLKGEPIPREKTVTRFRLVERLEHLGSMTTFILLVITGLPQVYSRSEFAMGIIRFFGGIQMTRYIHRTVGVIFVLLMVAHLVRAILGSLRKRQLPVMVPDKQDFLDTWQTIKHYVWRAPKPKVGKFDFGQKYEYWGLLLGGTVMSSTGLLLLFPELFSQVLPGLFLALAKVVHGLEGTFAVLVVVVWHTYGVILRPEIFPLDTTIFTGKMSVERLKEEHTLEYERIFGVTVPDEEGVSTEMQDATSDGDALAAPG
jgi:formate dehydrogenase gamma subunit